jgi:hypothetical protein
MVTNVPTSLQAALAEYRLFPHALSMQDHDADHWAHIKGTDKRRTCNGQMDWHTDDGQTGGPPRWHDGSC